ncbi:MAG TPA: hypothetical protein V6C86_07960 [Oculatellaceae cyanobacterium]
MSSVKQSDSAFPINDSKVSQRAENAASNHMIKEAFSSPAYGNPETRHTGAGQVTLPSLEILGGGKESPAPQAPGSAEIHGDINSENTDPARK